MTDLRNGFNDPYTLSEFSETSSQLDQHQSNLAYISVRYPLKRSFNDTFSDEAYLSNDDEIDEDYLKSIHDLKRFKLSNNSHSSEHSIFQ